MGDMGYPAGHAKPNLPEICYYVCMEDVFSTYTSVSEKEVT
jgi:hypothetical protein